MKVKLKKELKIKNVNPVRKDVNLYSFPPQGMGFSNGVKLKISKKTGDLCTCDLCSNKGIALFMALVMISTLAGVIMLCAFVLSHEVDKDERHQITRERMLEVRRALIGRLADTGGGKGITAGGGFISDFGEPGINPGDIDSFINNNFIPVLLDEPDAYPDWSYDSGRQFWAGYRVWAADDGSYLIAPPGQPNPTAQFWDGWGFPLEVNFVDDDGNEMIGAGENRIEIESWGSDGIDDGPTPPTDYGRDIVETFYWRRNVTVDIHNTSTDPITITVRLIYPFQGVVQATSASSTIVAGAIFQASFNNIPVGLRKIEILKGGVVKQTTVFSLPPGSGVYTLEQMNYSG